MKMPYLQLVIIILGVFMAMLDMSVINVAIPKMEQELNATTDQIQWVLTAYMLTIGVLVPISGWMTDKLGPKTLFLTALIVFTGGSVLCGAAWNLQSMVIFRVIQGLGGGFMMPVAMAMIFRIFPPDRRGTVMGTLGIAMIMAPAFGPALSGVLVDYSSWRWIFYLNVPVGLIAVILGFTAMHEFPHEVKGRFDWAGFAFSTVGFFSLLFGFNNVTSHGWKSTEVIGFLIVGIVCLIVFVAVELTVEHPMMNLRIMKNYMFSMSLGITSFINIAMFAGIFLLPLYLQNVMGFSAIRTGLFMTPAALMSAVIMPISGRLFDRVGARPLAIFGLFVTVIATFGFTSLDLQSSAAKIQWLYILRSIGMGFTMMPIMTAGMNTVPVKLVSQGTAITNTVRQVFSSLGTALLTSYMTTQTNIHVIHMDWQVTAESASGQALLKIQHLLMATKGMSLTAAKQAASAIMQGLISQRGFVAGLNDTYMVATILTIIAWIAVFFYGSKAERAAREVNRAKKRAEKAGQKSLPAQTSPAN